MHINCVVNKSLLLYLNFLVIWMYLHIKVYNIPRLWDHCLVRFCNILHVIFTLSCTLNTVALLLVHVYLYYLIMILWHTVLLCSGTPVVSLCNKVWIPYTFVHNDYFSYSARKISCSTLLTIHSVWIMI